MNPSPWSSFAKSVIGFLIFISISLGITVAVNSYAASQDQTHQTAAAFQALLQQKK